MFFKGNNKSWVLLAGLVCLIVMAIINIVFIADFASGHMKSDHWRHFNQILIPASEGVADFKYYWKNHHPNPILHFYEVFISGPIFNYDLKNDAYVSLSIHLVILGLLFTVFKKSVQDIKSSFLLVSAFVFLTIYWLSILTPHTFLWTLISLQSLGYIFGILAICSLVVFSLPEQFQLASRNKILLVASICCLGLLLNFDYGLLFFGSCFGALLVIALFHRDWRLLKETVILAVIFGVFTLLVNKLLLPPGSSSEGLDLVALLSTIPDFVLGIYHAIASAVVGETVFRPAFLKGVDRSLLYYFVVFGIGLFYTASGFIALKMGRKALPFLALLIYPVLFGLAVFLFRDTDSFAIYIGAPRYATNYKLGWIACFILIFMALGPYFQKRSFRFGFSAIALLLLGGWLYGTKRSYNTGYYWEASGDMKEITLYVAGVEPEATYRLNAELVGGNRNYDDTLAFLVDNKYNVFSEHYDHSDLLDRFKQNRDLFISSESNGFSYKITAKNGKGRECVVIDVPEGQAYKLIIDRNDTQRRHMKLFLPQGETESRFEVMPGTNIFYGVGLPSEEKICGTGMIEISR